VTYRYFPFENHVNGARERPVEKDCGPWICDADEFDGFTGEPSPFLEFLEMHKSGTGDGVVFRVSEWTLREHKQDTGNVRLGPCVILKKEKLLRLRDQLDNLIDMLEEGE